MSWSSLQILTQLLEPFCVVDLLLAMELLATIVSLILAVEVVFGLFVLVVSLKIAHLRLLANRRPPPSSSSPYTQTVGIFHPECHAAGGGERVLWYGVRAILESDPHCRIVIFAKLSSSEEPSAVLERASVRFGVKGLLDFLHQGRVTFVRLRWAGLLEPEAYPRLTLVGQSLGAMVVAAEALWKFVPDIWLDTVGHAFTYPVAWSCGCRVACYTHYPTVSTDMLERVWARRPAYISENAAGPEPKGSSSSTTGTNTPSSASARAVVNSRAKYVYYRLFSWAYLAAGRFAEVVMVNSTWTQNHIEQLWGREALVVFPPCAIDEFQAACKPKRERIIASLGQFRPEKDHRLQILSLVQLKERLKGRLVPKLVLFGSCRGSSDEARVEELREFAKKYEVDEFVEFALNVPFEELKDRLGGALLGIHTMWNEHFGIALVEIMAAGSILVAHNSGGPKTDIIKHRETGYLASTAEDYADAMLEVLDMHDNGKVEALEAMRTRAQESLDRFSEPSFTIKWNAAMKALLC